MTKTKNVTKSDIKTSGASLQPVRENMGIIKSKCIQNMYDHNVSGIAIDKRYITRNALQLLLIRRFFPRNISHTNTRPNKGKATITIKRYAEPKL